MAYAWFHKSTIVHEVSKYMFVCVQSKAIDSYFIFQILLKYIAICSFSYEIGTWNIA